MYCKKCKVNVIGQTKKCPLCHSPLESLPTNSEKQQAIPLPCPKKSGKKSFLPIYILLLLLVMPPFVTWNLSYNPQFLWSVVIFVCLSYIGFFIRTVVIGQNRFIRNLTLQAFVLTVLFFAVHAITGSNFWLLNYWLPAIYFFSYLLLIGYIKIRSFAFATANLIHTYILCILGQAPIITAFLLPLSLKWPSIISSALGLLFSISITIAYRKYIASELKKFFHL